MEQTPTAMRERLMKQLDRAVEDARTVFDRSLSAKLRLVLRHPKKALLRKIIVQFLGQRHVFTLKARTFFDKDIYVNNYEPHLWFSGIMLQEPEIRLTRYLIKHLPEGGSFFDIGAHHGFYTILAHEIAGPDCRIHAFEPARQHFRILGKGTGRLPNVVLNNLAVYKENGIITFYENNRTVSTIDPSIFAGKTKSKSGFTKVEVQATTLDAYCEKTSARPTFIKIDVEGAEADVIRGAEATLKRYHPEIALEAIAGVPTVAPRLLLDLGYEAFRISERGDLIPLSSEDVALGRGFSEGFDNLIFRYNVSHD